MQFGTIMATHSHHGNTLPTGIAVASGFSVRRWLSAKPRCQPAGCSRRFEISGRAGTTRWNEPTGGLRRGGFRFEACTSPRSDGSTRVSDVAFGLGAVVRKSRSGAARRPSRRDTCTCSQISKGYLAADISATFDIRQDRQVFKDVTPARMPADDVLATASAFGIWTCWSAC